MNISIPFIRRRIGTLLLAFGCLMLGAVAYRLLPVAPLPQVDFPTIAISADLPGASAETMASSVATPLERSLSDVPGVTQMTSSSSLGTTQIVLQFELGRSIDGAAQDVQTAINAAGGLLPKNLPNPPTYHKVNPADFTIMSIALTSATLPLTELDRYMEDRLAAQISQMPGVGLVDYDGQQRPAIRLQLDPDKVTALGLSLDDCVVFDPRKPGGGLTPEALRAARSERAFDRTYVRQQARSDARTLALYDASAKNGDSAAGRRFATEALPFIADEHAQSASLAGRIGG